MEILNTSFNRSLAATVDNRLRSDARMLRARAAAWYMGGFGVMALLIGAGIGLGFYGYAYVHDPRTSVEKMADAIGRALDRTKLTGEVSVKPDSRVALDTTGATVRLDTSHSVVRLDTGSVPRPSTMQLGTNAAPQSNGKVVTNYTVFKSVNYGNGMVVTGWKYSSNEDVSPRSQYCYYDQKEGDGSRSISLATDGIRQTLHSNVIDVDDAIKNCVWYQ